VTTPTRDDARLGWLDALRGFAALTVAWFHLSPQMIGTERHLALFRHLDLGKYGVLLFFLVSGYVIPMSLERHGSLRRFWVGRLFRIYPAYLLSAGLTLALVAAGRTGLPLSLRQETVTGVLGHATMMTDFLGVRGVVRVFWTLSYEMTFYLIVAGLFVWRLHRFSPWWAVGLTLTAVLGGRALPDGLFASTVADRRITAAVLVVLVGGSVAAYLSGRRRLALGAGAIGLFFVLLPVLNGSPTKWSTAAGSWQALLLLAVMFAGTVVYRVQHGQVSRWAAAIALCAVALALSGTAWLRTGSVAAGELWTANTAAVAGTFAIAFALRRRRMPRALTWLGAISFSLYVLHPIVLFVFGGVFPVAADRSIAATVGIGLLFALVTLVLSGLSYRLVELPGQALGRRVLRMIERRLGPDGRGPWRSGRIATQRAVPGTGRGENVRASV
jgi:peptidoglycan/LPS O-acetylase OafA/YrhL